jgi:hypothetical protein
LEGTEAGSRILGALPTAYGQLFLVDQTNLNKHRGLIPVDVLARYLAFPKLDHDHHRNLDPLPRCENAGQQPVHLDTVGEPVDQLVDHPVVVYGPRDRDDLDSGRLLRDEPLGVELPHLVQTNAAGEHGDMVDVRVVYHGPECILNAVRLELRAHVLVPEVGYRSLIGGECLAFLWMHRPLLARRVSWSRP